MIGVDFVRAFIEKQQATSFPHFSQLPVHVQNDIIVYAVKNSNPLYVRLVNAQFRDVADTSGGFLRDVAFRCRGAAAFKTYTNRYEFQSLLSAQAIRRRILNVALYDARLWETIQNMLIDVFRRPDAVDEMGMDMARSLLQRLGNTMDGLPQEGITPYYTALLAATTWCDAILEFEFENIEAARQITIKAFPLSLEGPRRAIVQQGYKLLAKITDGALILDLTVTDHQWARILEIGHKTTIEYVLRCIMASDEARYNELISLALEPKRKQVKR